jgi:exopolyphosphatase/guanosine-5'-triphosphate,3'-diphosphate pyrophosphatase
MFGIEPEVISGDMEASLSFRGATSSLTSMGKLKNTPYLVIDIGGGSTEFVLGVKHPTNSISVDIGCVRMSERHNLVEVFDPAQLAAARKDIQQAIEQAANQVEISTAGSIIGVAGTVTTVAAIALGLTEYDPTKLHGAVIKTSEVTRVAKMLREMTRTQKAAIPAMHPGRVDVIAAGALVLEMILDEVGLDEIIVSEHDILDGLALSLID